MPNSVLIKVQMIMALGFQKSYLGIIIAKKCDLLKMSKMDIETIYIAEQPGEVFFCIF